MEFGPRALGARSILGDARSRSMQSVMNLKIKFRESFRPFAPIVLREMQLLTAKPAFFVANVDEASLAALEKNRHYVALKALADDD